MVLGSKRETQGEPFSGGQAPLSRLHLLRSSQNKLPITPLLKSLLPRGPDYMSGGQNCLSLWTLQNQDVSDDVLRRGTKCIEADVKALHLESCSAARQQLVARRVSTLGVFVNSHFHPHSIHCPSNEPITLGLASTPR